MITATKPSEARKAIQGKDRVKELLTSIEKHQQLEIKSRADLILAREAIGMKLVELKGLVDHGAWSHHLAAVALDQRTAERLMAISRSPLGDRIRIAGTNVVASLPMDLQALASLSRLPAKLLVRALKRTHDEGMDRAQISRIVRELLKGSSKVESSSASRLRVAPSAAQDTKDERDDETNDDLDEDENQAMHVGVNETCLVEFLDVCEKLEDRLIAETQSYLLSEDATSSERERIMGTATRLSQRLRRMLYDLAPGEDD